MARALAAGGTWRRLVTDPLSGTVLDVGRRRYRPPAAMVDLVRARDVSCTHPGCDVPARRCDLDHLIPWSQGGTTSLDNLTCLCETHHRLKHTPGWSLRREPDGALVWRTPSGERYRRKPDGSVLRLARRVGPRHVLRGVRAVDDRLGRAVTDSVVAVLERGLGQGCCAALGDSGPRGTDLTRQGEEIGPLETRGPRPGERPGTWGAAPGASGARSDGTGAAALHELGLDVLLDAVVPF